MAETLRMRKYITCHDPVPSQDQAYDIVLKVEATIQANKLYRLEN